MAKPTKQAQPVDVTSEAVRLRLERALIARFGVDDGLDAVSEAMLFAATHPQRLTEMENPVGYLYRVGNTAGQRLRKRWTRTERLSTSAATHDELHDVDLERALLKLKPDERVAIVLVHSNGHSYAEAAELLDIPITTLNNHLTRGLARLRTLMDDQ